MDDVNSILIIIGLAAGVALWKTIMIENRLDRMEDDKDKKD